MTDEEQRDSRHQERQRVDQHGPRRADGLHENAAEPGPDQLCARPRRLQAAVRLEQPVAPDQ